MWPVWDGGAWRRRSRPWVGWGTSEKEEARRKKKRRERRKEGMEGKGKRGRRRRRREAGHYTK